MTLYEDKAVGSAEGRQSLQKQREVIKRHRSDHFLKSLRAHSRSSSTSLQNVKRLFNNDLESISVDYIAGDVNKSVMLRKSYEILASSTKKCFQLGIKAAGIVSKAGGLAELTRYEKAWLDTYLEEEFEYLTKFISQMPNLDEDQVIRRIGNYAETLEAAYESGRVLSVGSLVIIYWQLESGHPCQDCLFLARHSPYTQSTLPCVPKSGKTRCLNHCYCTLKIVKSDKESVNLTLENNKSAQWYLKKLKLNRKIVKS